MARGRTKQVLVDLIYPIATVVLAIILWHLSVEFFKLPHYILPSPITIPARLVASPKLFLEHSWYTIYETLVGLGLSIAVGIPLAILIVWSKTIEKSIMPLLVFSQTFPKSAIAPLLIIWFGFGLMPKVIISFLVAFFPIVINSVLGLRSVEPDMLDLIRSLSANEYQVFTKARIPTAVPYFFGGLKIAITLALIGAIVGEFVGADKGLGYLLMIANNRLDTLLCFASLVVLTFIGAIMFYTAAKLEGWMCPWHVTLRERTEQTGDLPFMGLKSQRDQFSA